MFMLCIWFPYFSQESTEDIFVFSCKKTWWYVLKPRTLETAWEDIQRLKRITLLKCTVDFIYWFLVFTSFGPEYDLLNILFFVLQIMWSNISIVYGSTYSETLSAILSSGICIILGHHSFYHYECHWIWPINCSTLMIFIENISSGYEWIFWWMLNFYTFLLTGLVFDEISLWLTGASLILAVQWMILQWSVCMDLLDLPGITFSLQFTFNLSRVYSKEMTSKSWLENVLELTLISSSFQHFCWCILDSFCILWLLYAF